MPLSEPPLREKDFLAKVWTRWFQGIKEILPSSGDVVSTTAVQTLTNKTLVSPVISNLTALRITYSDAAKILQSIADLTTWIAGTASQIIVTDDGDGTITLSAPIDLTANGIMSMIASKIVCFEDEVVCNNDEVVYI